MFINNNNMIKSIADTDYEVLNQDIDILEDFYLEIKKYSVSFGWYAQKGSGYRKNFYTIRAEQYCTVSGRFGFCFHLS